MSDRKGYLPPLVEAYLCISQIPDLGPVSFDRLTVLTHGKPDALLTMSPDQQMALGLNQAQISALNQPQKRMLDSIAHWLSLSDVNHIITRQCAAYPKMLRATKGAPVVLFCRGNLSV